MSDIHVFEVDAFEMIRAEIQQLSYEKQCQLCWHSISGTDRDELAARMVREGWRIVDLGSDYGSELRCARCVRIALESESTPENGYDEGDEDK